MHGIWLVLLPALVFFAGVVDALAGGGGLITLPAYLAAGLDPGLVLGTNKLASSIGTVASTLNYRRRLRFALTPLLPAIAASLVGSAAGAALAARLDPGFIRYLLVAALPPIAFLVVKRKDLGGDDRSGSLPPGVLAARGALVAGPIGFYDGFFGPGTGTFLAVAFARACRHDFVGATGRSKVLNLVSNVAALAAFLAAGRVNVGLGAAMGAASLAGHFVGSHWGLRRGSELIRRALVLVCGWLFLKVLLDLLRAGA